MNHDQALAIAAEVAPELIVVAADPKVPFLFAVKKTETGAPFSIHLPVTIDQNATPADALAQETEMFTHSLNEARRML